MGDSPDRALTRHCSAGTLKGRYGVSATGTFVGVGPVGFVGTADFDGVGNVTGADAASFNGAISFRNIVGTYEVNDDCTGSVTFVSPTRDVEVHFRLVIVDGGKEALFIETDPGTVLTGVLKRL